MSCLAYHEEHIEKDTASRTLKVKRHLAMNVTESKEGSFFVMSYERVGLEARIPGRCTRNTIICSKKRTVFRKRSCRKTVNFEEQIKSKDKYPQHISARNEGSCVYYPLA